MPPKRPLKTQEKNFLLYSAMLPATGNFITSLRIQKILNNKGKCFIRSICGFSNCNKQSLE